MKISVLTPVYGAEKYIAGCARSLFGQTHDDMEYVFVDDATPDRSMEILEEVLSEYPHRREAVKVVRHPERRGIAAARNTALDNATGEWVMFVDSDDAADPAAAEVLLAEAARTGADLVVCDANYIYHDVAVHRREVISELREVYIRQLLFRQATVALWAKLIRRELFEAHGVRFENGVNFGEDYAVTPRLAYHAAGIAKVDKPLYDYLRHNASSISNNRSLKSAQDMAHAGEILEEFFAGVPDADLYKGMMDEMKVRNKLAVILIGDRPIWNYAAALYPGLRYGGYGLSFAERAALWLTDRRMFRTLTLCRNFGLWLKRARG